MTLAMAINVTAAIALTVLLAGNETRPLEAIAAMAAKRGEYALGVRAAVWCERRDRATVSAPHRPSVARVGRRQRLKPGAEHATRRPLAGGIRR